MLLWAASGVRPVTEAKGRAVPVVDKDGRKFAQLDYRAPDHIEVVLGGRDIVRISRAHFVGDGREGELRLKVAGNDIFLGKGVTTIDGIDLGPVVEVVRDRRGEIEAVVVAGGGEEGALAVPPRFIREVAAHIILEPSAEEVAEAQPGLLKSKQLKDAVRRRGRGESRHD